MSRQWLGLAIVIGNLYYGHPAGAQELTRHTADSLVRNQPAFTIYKDNYFIPGIPLNQQPTKYNSDVKYQISFKDLLTRNTLPFHTYLFLTYTQVAFWAIYRNSSPFSEIDFNPAIGLAKQLFVHDRLAGVAALVLEHQSNGRDSIFSRSWNRVSLSFQGSLSSKAVLTVKGWIPFAYKEGNPDILQYAGYGELGFTYAFLPKKLILDILVRKGASLDWRGYAQTQLDYRPFKAGNTYFMLQWFQGYGEDLLNYNTNRSMLRIGLLLKPPYLNLY